ncbi:hypothetical protein TSUD_207630 [Trifolium subterraneum]|uniref:Reverse transcriptase domain-containing protein n=1 Tax=Trifolium subterraneum TaxID=3900 RepID=A0A2Z6NWM3_TRISU|nr:hypothetical protein TSUD_207630 [Trifolium subterraneum]
MHFISEFHRNGKLTKGLNSTSIALILKIDSPQQLNDFRPISLVDNLYKILAKVLANKLRLVIGSVISESQTVFVKDRQILDGILIANEVVDEARKSKNDLMIFEVDFEKAYDSVVWGYLDEVMGRMSFPGLWRKWIKECVCTATASILVNGSPTDEFPLERGLRQGDPLSPFLFLLAAEGRNVLMEAAVAYNLFTGYSIGERDSVTVSHLQFADDTLLLRVKSWANVRAVLVLFETMSGLKVNFHKSMLVGVNIPDSWLGEAASTLYCKVGKIPFFYLGLPIEGDSRRLSFWEPVLDRLKNKLFGWKNHFFSFGGCLVLLKSCLVFSSCLCPFLLQSSLSWKTICLQTECGGLGVRQVREFNLALLGKWCWRMLVDKEGLWFRVLAARYGVERGRLRVGGRRGSLWWREISCIREGGNKLRTVAEMFSLGWRADGEAWEWRRPLWAWEEEMLRECQALLLNLSLQAQSSNRWQWQPDPVGGYTVRGAYKLLTSQDSVIMDDADKLIWHSQLTLCYWLWEAESAHHLFISCSTFGSLWTLVDLERDAPFCSSFGLFVCELCGRKEITGYFEAQQAVPFNCSIRSSYSPLGG